jgi:hypothetical protein
VQSRNRQDDYPTRRKKRKERKKEKEKREKKEKEKRLPLTGEPEIAHCNLVGQEQALQNYIQDHTLVCSYSI